jgi:hypothetical protein
MAHWLDKVIELLNAETADLRELARIAGANPATFYRGINLADLDVNGQNLDGMQFSAGPDNEPNISSDKFKLLLDSDNREVEAIKAIQRTHQVKRQEERMAVLLDLICEIRKTHSSLSICTLQTGRSTPTES